MSEFRQHRRLAASTRGGAAALAASAVLCVGAPMSHAAPASSSAATGGDLMGTLSQACPSLVALGSVSSADGGATGQALAGLAQQALTVGVPVVQALVPVALSTATGNYPAAIASGVNALTVVAQQVLEQCPGVQLAFAGDGQGAAVVSSLLQSIGSGESPISADNVAAGALFGAPDRAAGSGLFPGTDKFAPTGDNTKAAVSKVPELDASTPEGEGVAASTLGAAPDFGALTGKVASLCEAGDLTCDLDPQSPTAQAVEQVTGATGDPMSALQAITETLVKTSAPSASQQSGGLLGSIVNALMGTGADPTTFLAGSRTGYTQPSTDSNSGSTATTNESAPKAAPKQESSGESAPTSDTSSDDKCSATERLDGNKLQTPDIIERVEWLDANCPATQTTVVGHSYGASRAGDVAEHFGPDYPGSTKFVLNADPATGRRSSLPSNTVINCNTLDPVCSPEGSATSYFPWHMPDRYPASYDNNPTGINMIAPDADPAAAKAESNSITKATATTTQSATTTRNAPAAASTGHNWDAVAQCESGGDWSINSGNGYYGGLQFSLSTWQANGGKGLPSDASKAEQIRVAENVLTTQGAGAWPTCGKDLGQAASSASVSSSEDATVTPTEWVSEWFTAAAQDATSN